MPTNKQQEHGEAHDAHEREIRRRAALATVAIIALAVIAVLVVNATIVSPAKRYEAAFALLDTGNEQEALEIFMELGDYKDAEKRMEELLELAEQEGGLRSESLDTKRRS